MWAMPTLPKLLPKLRDPKMNIYVAAKYLSDLRGIYLPLKDDYQTITEREMKALVGAYNRGAAYETLEDFWRTNYAQYGVKTFNSLKNSGCWEEF
jgi:soluble lytic murein transglycosylase-like protein